MMELLPNIIQQCFTLPFHPGSTYDNLGGKIQVQNYRISFSLAIDTDIASAGTYRSLNRYWYRCESCRYRANKLWKTSEFKVYESKVVPEFIQEEIRQHVEDHQTLGAWGISLYKESLNEQATRT